MTTPTDAPTSGTWHDQAPEVASAVAAQLRLAQSDPDRARLERSARAAIRAIDSHLQLQAVPGRLQYAQGPGVVVTYATGEAPADVLEAAHTLTAELAKRPLFGIADSWSPTGDPVRVARDHLAGVEYLLQPYVEGWGIA